MKKGLRRLRLKKLPLSILFLINPVTAIDTNEMLVMARNERITLETKITYSKNRKSLRKVLLFSRIGNPSFFQTVVNEDDQGGKVSDGKAHNQPQENENLQANTHRRVKRQKPLNHLHAT